jgi:hypothetical protein
MYIHTHHTCMVCICQCRRFFYFFYWKHLFVSNKHNDNAYKVLPTALQCIKTRNLTPWRDSNPGGGHDGHNAKPLGQGNF